MNDFISRCEINIIEYSLECYGTIGRTITQFTLYTFGVKLSN